MSSKLERMVNHKAELTKNYWQMKKDSKSEKSRANSQLAVMVNASQDAISVGNVIKFTSLSSSKEKRFDKYR